MHFVDNNLVEQITMEGESAPVICKGLLDLPPECLKLIVDFIDQSQLLHTKRLIRDILSLSHTCRYLKEVINEDYWKSWCFARRIGRSQSRPLTLGPGR